MNFQVGEIIYIDREKYDAIRSLLVSGYYVIVEVDSVDDRIIMDRSCSVKRGPAYEKVLYITSDISDFVFKVPA